MKLQSIVIAGFRGFPNEVRLDLDADAIIIAGANGSGKTSFFDALLWALSGSVSRLTTDPGVVVSEYSPTGGARVEVVLRDSDDLTATVVRRYEDGMHLSVQRGLETSVSGAAGEAALIDLLWPDAKAAADQAIALSRSLTRAIYLQQDAVRDFVDADDERTRFQVIGELVGVGRVGELQRQVEASRNAWTRATTTLEKELQPLEAQRRELLSRLERLGPGMGGPPSDYSEWLRDVEVFLRSVSARGLSHVAMGPDDPLVLDRVLGDLQIQEQALTRREAAWARLSAHVAAPPPPESDISGIALTQQAMESRRNEISARLTEAEREAAADRRRRVELEQQVASYRTFAELALQQLGDVCPVCAQQYDRAATEIRLREAATQVPSQTEVPAPADTIRSLAATLEVIEQELAGNREALRTAHRISEERVEWQRVLEELATVAGVDVKNVDAALAAREVNVTRRNLEALRNLRSRGERMALAMTRAAEAAQREELQAQLSTLDETIGDQQTHIASRRATGDMASRFLEALRNANDALVAGELDRIEPLLQRVFATVDPHPTLRAVSFLTRNVRGKGRLWTTLHDETGEVSVQEPGTVLSSSQLNVLAVSVFLSLNLSIPTLPLQLVALDDPLQSLDTVNLLGLSDLLRRVKDSRQVLVSTHDERLANLLERKLRPVSASSRTIRLDLEGWTSVGPEVRQRDIPGDSSALRLVVGG